MQLRNRQHGLGLWGWVGTLSMVGFVAMIVLQLVPLYLSEMAINKVVKQTAQDSGNAGLPIQDLRKNMKTRWDVEGITTLDVTEVKIVGSGAGRALAYDYEARAPLFSNISLVVHFQAKFPMAGGGGVE